LIASVALFGVLSLATPLAGSIAQLAALRLITAIGLGAALPAAISIAVAQCPPRLREAVTVIVGTGLAAGGVLGGVLGGILTSRFGWQVLFYVGGALPLILSVLLLTWLPHPTIETRRPELAPRDNKAQGHLQRIGGLLAAGRAILTVSLWAFSFLIFADAYALVFWLPLLLIGLGFPPAYSQLCVGFFSAGGLVANIAVMVLVSRFAIVRVMLFAACLAAISAAALSLHTLLPVGVWLPVAGAGAGLIACSVGQSALAVFIYPESLRTIGVGFSAAAGRIGSIAGPAAAGLLVSMSVSPKSIMLAATLPALLAICVLLLPARLVQRESR
jgi:MFS transporter, AAHS family, 4-hydroxybenzoate transporter